MVDVAGLRNSKRNKTFMKSVRLQNMELTRRKSLSFGGGLGLLSLSGCAGSPFSAPKLTLTLLNFDSESHFLDVEILRAESGEIVLQETFELSTPEEGTGAYELQKSDILNSQKYVIRANLRSNPSVRRQFLFYPDCTGDGEPNEELNIEIHQEEEDDEPFIQFNQIGCS